MKIRNIEIPPNGEAVYDPKAHTVTVSAPEDIIERSAELWIELKPVAVRFVFTLVEFSAADSLDLPDLGYEQLRKLAGDSWRVRDRVTLVCESGRAATSNLTGKNAPSGKTATRPGKRRGLVRGRCRRISMAPCEAEPQIGPDGITIEVSFVYNHRIRATPDQPSMLMRIQGNTTLTHNVPLVVQTATLAPPKGDHREPAKELAVMVQASVIDRHGRSMTMEPVEGGVTAQLQNIDRMKIFPSLILGCLLVSTGDGAGAEQKKPCPLRTKVFQVPPGFHGPYPEPKPGEVVPWQRPKDTSKPPESKSPWAERLFSSRPVAG